MSGNPYLQMFTNVTS